MTEHTAPQLGDNLPPSEIEAFEQNLSEANRGIADRIGDLQVGLARVPDTITDENAVQATDFIAQCRAELKEAETRRKAAVKPLNDRKDRVQAFFKGLVSPAQKMVDEVTARLQTYHAEKQRLERERLAAERAAQRAEEQAQREAAEAAQREAEEKARQAKTDEDRRRAAAQFAQAEEARGKAATAAEAAEQAERAAKGPVHIKGDSGATAYATTRWTHEVFDLGAVPLPELARYFKPEHVDAAIRAWMKDRKPSEYSMAGVAFSQESKTRVRA